jgi:receptor-type tyrosine-protein phosphatase kappa
MIYYYASTEFFFPLLAHFSAPTLPDYEGVDASLNETATTITVLLRPAQAKGAPIW